MFASAGLDRQVKLWSFDAGTCLAVGSGHAGTIRRVRIAPDGASVASVGDDGALILWAIPPAVRAAAAAAGGE